jgi:hypothetical protein
MAFKFRNPFVFKSEIDKMRDRITEISAALAVNANKRRALKDEAVALQVEHDALLSQLVNAIKAAPAGTVVKPASIPSGEGFGGK